MSVAADTTTGHVTEQDAPPAQAHYLWKRLESLDDRTSFKWTAYLLAVGFGVVGAAFASYLFFFGHYSISDDPADWGVFGDYIGGTANPILSFLTVGMLAITIALQAKQLAVSSNELRLSREELEMTRAELARSALAQEHSERALKAQAAAAETTANLAAIRALLEHYSAELQKHQGKNYPSGDLRIAELNGIRRRERVLRQRLEHFYATLTGDEEHE